MIRIAAAILFLAVLIGKPAAVKATGCTLVNYYPPNFYAYACDDMSCEDAAEYFYYDENCHPGQAECTQYEWGALVTVQCS